MRTALLTSLLALGLAGTVAAREETTTLAVDQGAFADQKAAVLKAIDSDRYAELKPAQRQEIQQALGRIEAAFAEKGSVEAMNEPQRVAVFNDQELINTRLSTAAEDGRRVCTRERRPGSNMPEVTCLTVAERRRIRESARRQMLQSETNVNKDVGG
ncbi:hypothetical protein [Silanimonas sp.]|jgi:hypothetical protein|uniref:hypothetical protein n=1 Tax=Silanimonas sp. TaxID=1929290 RepID=UPI0022C40C80|nr:hypothetical protein [Silanimonas sp.]MCZ8116008.1 hypothetical protein [Silanimonas sp.]